MHTSSTPTGRHRTLHSFPTRRSSDLKVLPARGAVSNGQALKEFHDMIVAVRDRVQKAIQAGRTEDQVIAAHPSAAFDAKWGNGRVKPDDFVHEIYAALKAQ